MNEAQTNEARGMQGVGAASKHIKPRMYANACEAEEAAQELANNDGRSFYVLQIAKLLPDGRGSYPTMYCISDLPSDVFRIHVIHSAIDPQPMLIKRDYNSFQSDRGFLRDAELKHYSCDSYEDLDSAIEEGAVYTAAAIMPHIDYLETLVQTLHNMKESLVVVMYRGGEYYDLEHYLDSYNERSI